MDGGSAMAIQDPLTELIIGCCFRVANELGPGFLEKGHVLVEVKAASALGNADVAGSIRNFVFGRVSSGLDLQVQGCGRSKCWG